MRLIDADEFCRYTDEHCQDGFADLWKELIRRQPTAFDKEKVIEELLRKQHEALKIRNDKDTSCTAELKAFWHSRLEAYTLALEIVEKGGIENEEI